MHHIGLHSFVAAFSRFVALLLSYVYPFVTLRPHKQVRKRLRPQHECIRKSLMLVRHVLRQRRVTLPPATRLVSTVAHHARRPTSGPEDIPTPHGAQESFHHFAPFQLPRIEPPQRTQKLTTLCQHLKELARTRKKEGRDALDRNKAGSTKAAVKTAEAKSAKRQSYKEDCASSKTERASPLAAHTTEVKAAAKESSKRSRSPATERGAPLPVLRKKRGRPRHAKQLPPRLWLRSDQSKHHDLESFLAYTAARNLSTVSNVYRGTNYEYVVQQALRSYHFNLHRTGQSNDLGIDLLGEWSLPHEMAAGDQSKELKVLIQCKISTGKPCNVRELEGAYVGAPTGWGGNGVMAFLISAKPATLGVRAALQRSRLPMGFLQITESGLVQQFIWNHVAQEARLAGMSTTNAYSAFSKKMDNIPESKIALMYQGRPFC